MTNILKISSVKDAKKAYDEEEKRLYKMEQALDKERKKAGCYLCLKYSEYLEMPLEKRYAQCNCKNARTVTIAYRAYLDIWDSIAKLEKVYAKAVFEILNKEKPRIYSKATKKTVEWDEEFPRGFEGVSKNVYSSIIGLADGSGGRYVFA